VQFHWDRYGKGKEQIFLHAEKDEDIRVKNNCREAILGAHVRRKADAGWQLGQKNVARRALPWTMRAILAPQRKQL